MGKRNIRRTLEPWMIQAAIEHISEGCSMHSFRGKYNIPYPLWLQWIRENAELNALNEEYKKMVNAKKKWKQQGDKNDR